MRVVFRTDASLEIGNGHVMRCLTLADALAANGADCSFVCRELPGNLIDYIHGRGFACHHLPDRTVRLQDEGGSGLHHRDWLGADLLTDAEQTHALLLGEMVDWIVVDHYAISESWEKYIRRACLRIMVIDDLADRPHDCDMLLDQNFGRLASEYRDITNPGCVLMIGPQYALLRPDFPAFRNQSLARRIKPILKEIILSMGGVDKNNVTGDVLEALKKCDVPADCHITVVMGPNAPWLEKVKIQADQMPWPTSVRINVQDMARLMADSDIAIGAAGSTSWERCALGLPSLLVVLAENQREVATALRKAGAAIVIETAEKLPDILQKRFDEFAFDASSLRSLSERAAAICDGQGTSRVSAKLLRCEPA